MESGLRIIGVLTILGGIFMAISGYLSGQYLTAAISFFSGLVGSLIPLGLAEVLKKLDKLLEQQTKLKPVKRTKPAQQVASPRV